MEFPFNINDILSQKIIKVGNNLLPEGYTGDRRSSWDCASKISDILDEMGRLSAVAQGLRHAITSGERLRKSEQTVYILIDPVGKSGQGSVVGLLKVGRKKLFVFDETGAHHEMQALCVLDFYVHESKQRMGCGKALYEYMLTDEKTSPQYLAIDRPSEKFLGFLYRHYGLERILPQTNNFVVFEGFFNENPDEANNSYPLLRSRLLSTSSAESRSNCAVARTSQTKEECNGLQQSYGRYAAYRMPTTMGKGVSGLCVVASRVSQASKKRAPMERHLPFNTLHSTVSRKTELVIITAVRTANPAIGFVSFCLQVLQNVFPQQQQQQHNGGTFHSAFDLSHEPPLIPADDCTIQETCKSPKSFVMELTAEVNSAPASCRLHHSTSPIKRDLKFSHSPLW